MAALRSPTPRLERLPWERNDRSHPGSQLTSRGKSSDEGKIKGSRRVSLRRVSFHTPNNGLFGCRMDEICVVVDEKRLHIQKNVLSEGSEYFRALLASGMKESQKNQVVLHGVSLAAFQVILEFLISDNLCCNDVSVEEVLDTAVFLQMEGLLKYVTRNMTVATCVACLRIAEKHFIPSLGNAAYRFMTRHYIDLLKSEEFNRLPTLQKRRLASYRRTAVPPAPFELNNSSQHFHLAEYEPTAAQFMCAVGNYNVASPKSPDDPRPLYAFNHLEAGWQNLGKLPDELSTHGCSVCVIHNFLVILGGYTNAKRDSLQTKAFVYDPLFNAWSAFQPLPTPRALLGLATMENHDLIFAIGGSVVKVDSSGHPAPEPLACVEVYDLRKGEWREGSRLPKPIVRSNAVTLSMEGNKWDRLTVVPRIRFVTSMTSWREKLFVIGQRAHDFEVDPMCFDLESKEWTTLLYRLHVPQPLRNEGTPCFDDFTLVSNGEEGSYLYILTQHMTHRYNLAEEKWEDLGFPGCPALGSAKVMTLQVPISKLTRVRH
ncbi:PREDICTED: kelch repeat and BTB domain-containing protein 11-like [Branchiostoma belcheri]|uniref:Kelch repeat and BTB domain-containing protein 11-like n=1 Tax=Branchiostoma belcheri TaxID=7741 RepID=A0A6P5A275_BRABE|nr:PREDICTED: kelch repeat and BTB domain-containing protein 11-like [Branchiostoma belcheri]